MVRCRVLLAFCLSGVSLLGQTSSKPSFDYDAAQTHEIKPHRRTIPLEGVREGFNQLHLTLTVSAAGDVVKAGATGDQQVLPLWPRLEGEVLQWKFVPFEQDGKPVTAEVEEYIDLVPPERLPKVHVIAPVVRPDSKVEIALRRTGCFGNCPSYTVTVSTDGVVFEGQRDVVATGRHTDRVDADGVRKLAKEFVAVDFYSMSPAYRANVTDMPTFVLSITVDGQKQEVMDYAGRWVGMPGSIEDLEDTVDDFARTKRWIEGEDGLVPALQAEKFNFETFDAQVMLKAAAQRGETATVRQFFQAGVPLKPLLAPKPKEESMSVPFENVGWLNAASRNPEALKVLIDEGASKDDQSDKDFALGRAAEAGNLEAVRALIAYGANPNADFSKRDIPRSGGSSGQHKSVLFYAAESGNPEVLREILRYHPKLEEPDYKGQTAMFGAVDSRDSDADGARVECVRLLAEAGAKVNARDRDGNTPLHETFLTDVEEELLKLGADVNARNKDGETPIFTTVDDEAIPLLIAHGADVTIRNKSGETVVEAAKEKGPQRQEVLREALLKLNQR